MQGLFNIILVIILSIYAGNSNKPMQLEKIWSFNQEDNQMNQDSEEPEYSSNMIIISVKADATENELTKLFEKYDLTVVYDYNNFNMYALKTSREMSDEELDKLISELEQDDNVLMAEKDYIMQLD